MTTVYAFADDVIIDNKVDTLTTRRADLRRNENEKN